MMKRSEKLLLVAILLAWVLPASLASEELQATFATMTFDKASEGLFLKSVPLRVAFPSDYVLQKNQPMHGNWLWTTQQSVDHMKQKGFPSPDEGVFQIRVAKNLGYDRDSDSFICGPGCTEADFSASVEAAGATEVSTTRHLVNGVPILILEATMPARGPYPPSRIYMAHIALFIETNAALFAYTPPSSDPARGDVVWAAAKKALLQAESQ